MVYSGLHQLHLWLCQMPGELYTTYQQMTVKLAVQMVSLLHLAEITEQGVNFASPVDGSKMLLTPEHSIAIQNQLGAHLPRLHWCLL